MSFGIKFNNLNIYYQNVRGLKTKTHNFYRNVCCTNYDIIALTETWLNCYVTDRELFHKNYTVYRRDRVNSDKKDGGGILLAVSNKLTSKHMVSLESVCEDLWVIIDIPSCDNVTSKLAVCVAYLAPPVQRCTLDAFINNCNRFLVNWDGYTCILGDFNLSQINWNMLENDQSGATLPLLCQDLVDFTYVNNLKQLNSVPNSKGKILDLVMSDVPSTSVSESNNLLSNVDPYLLLIFSFPLLYLQS